MNKRLSESIKACRKEKGTFVCSFSSNTWFDSPVYLDIYREDINTYNVYCDTPDESNKWKRIGINIRELNLIVGTWEETLRDIDEWKIFEY